jgi:hypothetical protein
MLFVVATAVRACASPYSFTTIEAPGSNQTYATGINNRGEITAQAPDLDTSFRYQLYLR